MNGNSRGRRQDFREKKRESSDDSSQWMMQAFNLISNRLDRIDDRLDRIDKAVGNLKKVVWTAAGAILVIGIVASVLVGFTDLIASIPFEITIRNTPTR